MRKFDRFFIITLVASLIISVATGVPHVRAETTTGSNQNTTLTTANYPTTKSTVQQQTIQEDQQQQEQQPTEKQQPIVTPNHRPSATAGPDKKVNEGVNVVLDASHSSDPDMGNKLTYSWRQIAGRPLVDLTLSTDAGLASFTAPDVNRDSTFTFVVSVRDDKGAQDLDTVKVTVKNFDKGIVKSGTPNSNNALNNTTANTLSNAQRNIPIKNNNNASQLQTNALANQMARTSAITVQATLSPLQAFPTNSLVNNRAFYDISFKTASSGTIRQVMLAFPAGTVVSQSAVVEVSGIGLGTFSSSGQTVTYTVTSPTTIPAGVTIRLQVDYIFNPATPNPVGGYKIQVTTKDPNGATIDSGLTSGYQIKRIETADIADNAITTAKIQDGQVGSSDLAPFAIVPQVIQRLSPTETLVPGELNEVRAVCNPEEVATGGGFFLGTVGTPDDSTKVPFLRSVALTNDNGRQYGWIVFAKNTDTVDHAFTAVVGCLKLN